MSVPKKRPQPGPGAPLTTEREQYRRLMAQGLNNHQACLQIGVHPTTGSRWSKGRNMVDHTGKPRYYPPVHGEPKAISPRYLSEDERILIGDLLAAGHSQRSVGVQLRAVRGAPQSAGPPAPAEIGQTGPRRAITRLRAGPPGAAVEPAADLPRPADRVPRPTGEAFGARDHLPGLSSCRLSGSGSGFVKLKGCRWRQDRHSGAATSVPARWWGGMTGRCRSVPLGPWDRGVLEAWLLTAVVAGFCFRSCCRWWSMTSAGSTGWCGSSRIRGRGQRDAAGAGGCPGGCTVAIVAAWRICRSPVSRRRCGSGCAGSSAIGSTAAQARSSSRF